ncbi:hypothetical protein, partial [Phenylobacterium sp.]|uniref:hypothetical protein n=1 Tax=Phenylobacterium sp. TaxID=1871053 RepID=UPI002FCA6112
QGDNVLLADNIVAGYADMKARITLADDTNVTLTNNQATDYILHDTVEFIFQGANDKLATPTDGGLSLLKQWSFAHEAVPGGLQAPIPTSLDTFIQPISPTTGLPGGPETPIVLPVDFGQFAFSFF